MHDFHNSPPVPNGTKLRDENSIIPCSILDVPFLKSLNLVPFLPVPKKLIASAGAAGLLKIRGRHCRPPAFLLYFQKIKLETNLLNIKLL
jgi:hypothetical protein